MIVSLIDHQNSAFAKYLSFDCHTNSRVTLSISENGLASSWLAKVRRIIHCCNVHIAAVKSDHVSQYDVKISHLQNSYGIKMLEKTWIYVKGWVRKDDVDVKVPTLRHGRI